MSECMTFPDTVEEFMDSYMIVDTEQVYTNGTALVPIYRMRQWFEHEQKKGYWIRYYRMHTGDTFYCSRCGSCFVVIQGSTLMNYCPNCMSDNREASR